LYSNVTLSFCGLRCPDPPHGICPWTLLGEFRPRNPTQHPFENFWIRPRISLEAQPQTLALGSGPLDFIGARTAISSEYACMFSVLYVLISAHWMPNRSPHVSKFSTMHSRKLLLWWWQRLRRLFRRKSRNLRQVAC